MKKLFLFLTILLSRELYSQSLSVFDIDTSAFPTIKAKFYAFDASGNQILNLSPSDFEVTEDGVKRNVTYVSCPAPKPPVPISSVLTIDVSGSMSGSGIGYAKEAAKAWVQAIPLGQSECAITSFNSNNFFNQDFTTNRNRLLNRIEELTTSDGTDFNAALINPMSGGLLAVEKGKYKKVVILLTDGYASGNETAIIQKANQINAIVFCVTIATPCPQILRNISEKTGGQWFENITTAEQAREVYLKILKIVQGEELCDIDWESDISCTSGMKNVEINLKILNIISQINYFIPNRAIARLEFEPYFIYIKNKEPGINHDTTITVIARGSDFVVSDIISSNSSFQLTLKNFIMKAGESKNLTLNFTPTDSGYIFTELDFVNNVCPQKYFASGGFRGIKPSKKTLKLTHPNGGEVFVIGSDTVITWEGITEQDTVLLEYSIDNGNTWKKISDKASGLKYIWMDIPIPESKQCKIRVMQNGTNYIGGNSDTVALTLGGHVNGINNVNWSPDGTRVATASDDGLAIIWEPNTGVNLQILSGHTDHVYSVIWSPDGFRVSTLSRDTTIRIWDVKSGVNLLTLKGHKISILSQSWSPDGSQIATASEDNTVIIWNAVTGNKLLTLIGHTSLVVDVSWSPDGTRVATTGWDNKAIIWDATTGAILHSLIGHTARVNNIDWNPDGFRVVTSSNDSTAIIWDAVNGAIQKTLKGHTGKVKEARWNPSGSRIVTSSRDLSAKIWDTSSGICLQTLIGHTSDIHNVSWSPDGMRLATSSSDHSSVIWDAVSGSKLQTLVGYTSSVNDVCWSPDGTKVATANGGFDNSTIIWDATSGSKLQILKGHNSNVKNICWSYDCTKLATASSDFSTIIWDAAIGCKLHTLYGHTDNVENLGWSTDDKKVATVSLDGKAIIWDASTGAKIQNLFGHNGSINNFNWSPDCSRIVTASRDNTAIIWNVYTGEKLQTLIGHNGIVVDAEWSPEGSRIATASLDGTAIIWDANSGVKLLTLIKHKRGLKDISWSPDGSRVATSSYDSTAIIWDATKGIIIQTLIGHYAEVNNIVWNPDGSIVATSSKDSTAIIWEVSSGSKLQTLSLKNYSAYYICWSPDGSKVATANGRIAIIWDISNGAILQTLSGHLFYINTVSWSSDGLRIATASEDCTAKIWDIGENIITLQEDISDSVFSIVAPKAVSQDIDIGKVFVNTAKDSVFHNFISNIGSWKFRVDSIYFRGVDAPAFSMLAGFPKYEVEAGKSNFAEIRFAPTEIRNYQAEIVIITQFDTLIQNIIGEGVKEELSVFGNIIDFGIREIADYKDTTMVLITNNSTNPVNINSIIMLGPDKEQFEFVNGNVTPLSLNSGESQTMTLRFNPKYIGRTSGQIGFFHNATGSPSTVQLFGAGIGAQISASIDSAYAGEVVDANIKLESGNLAKFAELIGSFDGVLRVENSILAPVNKSDLNKTQNDSAYIKFSGNVNSKSSTIASLKLKAGLGRVEETSIDFENINWYDTDGNLLDYDTEFSSGHFRLLGICREGGTRLVNPNAQAGMMTIAPNPAENKLEISLSLTEKGQTDICIYNVLGEVVQTIFSENVVQYNTMEISTDLSGLSTGQYLIILRTPTYIESSRLMIIK